MDTQTFYVGDRSGDVFVCLEAVRIPQTGEYICVGKDKYEVIAVVYYYDYDYSIPKIYVVVDRR